MAKVEKKIVVAAEADGTYTVVEVVRTTISHHATRPEANVARGTAAAARGIEVSPALAIKRSLFDAATGN